MISQPQDIVLRSVFQQFSSADCFDTMAILRGCRLVDAASLNVLPASLTSLLSPQFPLSRPLSLLNTRPRTTVHVACFTVFMFAHQQIFVCLCAHMYVCIHLCRYTCIYASLYVCTYICGVCVYMMYAST